MRANHAVSRSAARGEQNKTALQHAHHDLVISTLHAHLDGDNCLEVILLRGPGEIHFSLTETYSSQAPTARPGDTMLRISTKRMHVAVMLLSLSGFGLRIASATELSGELTDPQGQVLPNATVRMLRRADASIRETRTDASGRFTFPDLNGGEYRITVEFPGFAVLDRTLAVHPSGRQAENIQFSSLAAQAESVNVTASVTDRGVFEPDPAQQVMIRDQTLDANPGRPGMPISIPGMPVESPAGGVKPPQYFVPGVAGDHGEPIAMFFQVGGYLFPTIFPPMRTATATPTRTSLSPPPSRQYRRTAPPSTFAKATTP